MFIADIILEQTAYSFDKPYGYTVPSELRETLKPGCRVIVPFGKGNTPRQGMILEIRESENNSDFKQISRLIDTSPILSEEMLLMCKWMHEHCFCTYFDAVKAVLPLGISFKVSEVYEKGEVPFSGKYLPLEEYFSAVKNASAEALLSAFDSLSDRDISVMLKENMLKKGSTAVRRMGDPTIRSARLKVSAEELTEKKLTPRQLEVAQLIADLPGASIKEISYFTGASQSVFSTLQKRGIIEIFEKESYRSPIKQDAPLNRDKINLTSEQNTAFNTLKDLMNEEKGNAALLYGVTGSGKTSVFLSLVDEAIEKGKGAIIMVPEISLTPQTVSIFGNRYGKKVALFHSAMSLGQRMDEWKRVKNGDATLAIGTRSAIFAPVKDLSLIIIDEEQEHTYKSEQSPRFHARDLAKFRAAHNKALLVLASATPSLESYTAAKIGKYTLCTLKERYGGVGLPQVKTVDMRAELREGNSGPLSRELKYAVNEALEKGKQAIILLNRRGHNTYISCPTCGYVATCPNCSISMTYHSANGRLMCHYCNYSEPAAKKCPTCTGTTLKFMGIGTQKIEEELKATFPDASILRLDADSTGSKDSFSSYLGDFAEGKYNIMLGTQMVAKGLNFPNVTVVGVIGADSAANSTDYRSFERSFSLLTQVLGRAGRGEEKGLAIVQTTDPDSNLIRLAAAQDYDSFYDGEIGIRKMLIYPPYCDIVQITVKSSDRDEAEETAKNVFDAITKGIQTSFSDIKLKILGPAPAAMPKISGKYRFRLIIKAKNSKRFRELIRNSVLIKTKKDTSVSVDMNPETVI